MSFISVKNIEKSFGRNKVLNGMSFDIQRGEQVAVVGASGSGKSTLMYILGGLDKEDSGKVLIDNMNLSELGDEERAKYRNESIGFIFQFHFLLPSMSSLDNILLPAKIAKRDLLNIEKWVESLAEDLGVTHCLKKFPYELSGGEQQRINIIRALSLRPKILLCDEPTGNLDSKNSEIVVSVMKSLSRELNSTLIVVTHDARVSDSFDRKITIEDGHIIS